MREALVAGLSAFVDVALGASPAHVWLDSGELGPAGATLGVMHPPGAPGRCFVWRRSSQSTPSGFACR